MAEGADLRVEELLEIVGETPFTSCWMASARYIPGVIVPGAARVPLEDFGLRRIADVRLEREHVEAARDHEQLVLALQQVEVVLLRWNILPQRRLHGVDDARSHLPGGRGEQRAERGAHDDDDLGGLKAERDLPAGDQEPAGHCREHDEDPGEHHRVVTNRPAREPFEVSACSHDPERSSTSAIDPSLKREQAIESVRMRDGTVSAPPRRMARICMARSSASLTDVSSSPEAERVGDYRLLAPLGRGGTAGVYLAEHGVTGELVALKVLDPFFCDNAEIVGRLLAEREISERVHHAGLLDVLDAGRTDAGVPYLVMEYLEGESLQTLLDRGELDCDTLVAVAAQVAAALGALHAAGFAHCDIKPSNVFVLSRRGRDSQPRIKLIDFGVARRLDEPTVPGAIAGTPAYMAPEQWRGQAGPASDVYSLGCMLYEMVTGRPVFSGSLPYLMASHRHRRPAPPSAVRADLSPDLEQTILRALAKNPADRPSTSSLAASLSSLAASLARIPAAIPFAAAS